eukprot:gene673-1033_t
MFEDDVCAPDEEYRKHPGYVLWWNSQAEKPSRHLPPVITRDNALEVHLAKLTGASWEEYMADYDADGSVDEELAVEQDMQHKEIQQGMLGEADSGSRTPVSSVGCDSSAVTAIASSTPYDDGLVEVKHPSPTPQRDIWECPCGTLSHISLPTCQGCGSPSASFSSSSSVGPPNNFAAYPDQSSQYNPYQKDVRTPPRTRGGYPANDVPQSSGHFYPDADAAPYQGSNDMSSQSGYSTSGYHAAGPSNNDAYHVASHPPSQQNMYQQGQGGNMQGHMPQEGRYERYDQPMESVSDAAAGVNAQNHRGPQQGGYSNRVHMNSPSTPPAQQNPQAGKYAAGMSPSSPPFQSSTSVHGQNSSQQIATPRLQENTTPRSASGVFSSSYSSDAGSFGPSSSMNTTASSASAFHHNSSTGNHDSSSNNSASSDSVGTSEIRIKNAPGRYAPAQQAHVENTAAGYGIVGRSVPKAHMTVVDKPTVTVAPHHNTAMRKPQYSANHGRNYHYNG